MIILFNTREWAIIIWSSILIIIAVVILIKQNKHKSIFNIFKALIKVVKHPIMITALIYIGLLFYLFYSTGIIKGIDLIKDYIKLLIFALIPMIFKVATNYKEVTISEIPKDILKFSIIPLFVINEYTFNIFLELIIVLLSTLLALLLAVSGSKPEWQTVNRFFNWCLVILGVYIVVFAFRSFIGNLDDIQSTLFWKKMFLELLLLCHIPLLIFIQLSVYYENIVVLLKIKTGLADTIKGRIKVFFILFKNCRTDKIKLEEALQKLRRTTIHSYSDLESLLN